MARDVISMMWADALELLAHAERSERSMFKPGRQSQTPCWEPPIDLFETETELWIIAALPGVKPEQVELRIDNDMLVVSGTRPLPLPKSAGVIHRLELPHGRFERIVRMPAGRFEIVQRELALGCLTIVLRKSPSEKGQQ